MRLKHFFACLLAVALLCGCTPRTAEVQTPPVQSPPKPEQAEPTSPPQPPAAPAHATLLAVGDNLIHDVIYWQAKTDDGYDFLPAYQAVAPLIQQADLSFINQETPVVAENPPASYPLFNSLYSWQTACSSLALTSSISPTTICSTSTQRDCKAPFL